MHTPQDIADIIASVPPGSVVVITPDNKEELEEQQEDLTPQLMMDELFFGGFAPVANQENALLLPTGNPVLLP